MKNKEYVPKEGDTYWCVDLDGSVFSTTNAEGPIYARILEFGNFFRTEKEAEAAAEKTKALLLSLHNNDENLQDSIQAMVTNVCQAMDEGKENVAKATCTFGNLTKLTAEVFDRPDCPEWAKYAAVDENGCAYWYPCKPNRSDNFFRDTGWKIIPGKFDAADWQNSLIERHVKGNKLPEWCKVDAIGWHKRCGYFKVTYIDDVSERVDIQQIEDKSKGYLSFHTVRSEAVRHLRPFNTAEMKALVGRTVDSAYATVLVTKFYSTREGGEVCVDGIYYNADKLLDEFTINNKPAGVLEHLEGDEWVD